MEAMSELQAAEEVGGTQVEEMRRYFKESSIAEQCLGGEPRSADVEEEHVGILEEDEKTDVMEMLNLGEHDGEAQENGGGANATVGDALGTVDAEREEGEVDEDIAKCINAELVNGSSKVEEESSDEDSEESEEEEDDDEEEEEDEDDEERPRGNETMEDSDPIHSDNEEESSSDEEDWRAGLMQCLNNQHGERKQRANSSDDEDEDDKPLKTKNESSNLPRVPSVEVQLEPHHILNCVGRISSVVGLMVIVEGEKGHQALDEGSILWLPEKKIPLGFVDEVFGPVKQPFYAVRFNDATEISEDARVSAPVAYVPDFAKMVLKTPTLYKKGYDASGLYDEELSNDEVDFSDDEKEAEFKRERTRAKRAQHEKEEGDHSQEKRTRNGGNVKGGNSKREPARNNFRQGRGMRRDDRHSDMMNVYQHVQPEGCSMGYTNSTTTTTQTPPGYWPQQFITTCGPNTTQVLQPTQYQLPMPQAFQQYQGQQFSGMPYPPGYAFVPGQMAPPGFVQGMATVPSPGFMPYQTWWPTVTASNETLQQQAQQTQQVQPQQPSPSGNSDRAFE